MARRAALADDASATPERNAKRLIDVISKTPEMAHRCAHRSAYRRAWQHTRTESSRKFGFICNELDTSETIFLFQNAEANESLRSCIQVSTRDFAVWTSSRPIAWKTPSELFS
jgi:hypothetical protein